MRFLYLHGFASSPQSRKAQAFQSALRAAGISLEIPALDGGDFEHLTISGQLAIIEDLLRGEPARLIGSSLGGYLAALYAAGHPEVSRAVLLAPAFGFAPRLTHLKDALQYLAAPDFTQPALIFHGLHDDVVPVQYSRDFAAAHSNTRLVELESGHDLLDVLDRIVAEALAFL